MLNPALGKATPLRGERRFCLLSKLPTQGAVEEATEKLPRKLPMGTAEPLRAVECWGIRGFSGAAFLPHGALAQAACSPLWRMGEPLANGILLPLDGSVLLSLVTTSSSMCCGGGSCPAAPVLAP